MHAVWELEVSKGEFVSLLGFSSGVVGWGFTFFNHRFHRFTQMGTWVVGLGCGLGLETFFLLGGGGFFLGDFRRFFVFDDLFCNGYGGHFGARGDVIHDVEHDAFEDGSEGACAGAAFDGFVGEGAEGIVCDGEFDTVHGELFAVLFEEGVAWLGEDFDEFIGS